MAAFGFVPDRLDAKLPFVEGAVNSQLDASNDPSNLSRYTDFFADKSRASDRSYFFTDVTDIHGQLIIDRFAWANAPRSPTRERANHVSESRVPRAWADAAPNPSRP